MKHAVNTATGGPPTELTTTDPTVALRRAHMIHAIPRDCLVPMMKCATTEMGAGGPRRRRIDPAAYLLETKGSGALSDFKKRFSQWQTHESKLREYWLQGTRMTLLSWIGVLELYNVRLARVFAYEDPEGTPRITCHLPTSQGCPYGLVIGFGLAGPPEDKEWDAIKGKFKQLGQAGDSINSAEFRAFGAAPGPDDPLVDIHELECVLTWYSYCTNERLLL